MRRTQAALALGTTMLSAGCQDVGPEVAGAPVAGPPPGELVLTAGGIAVGSTGLEISFWRTEASTIPAVSKLVGRAPRNGETREVPGCGRVVTWPKGLELTFIDGNFRGWAADPRRLQFVGEGLRVLADGRLSAGRVCG